MQSVLYKVRLEQIKNANAQIVLKGTTFFSQIWGSDIFGSLILFLQHFLGSDICQHSWCTYQGPGPGAPQLGVEHAGDRGDQEEYQDAANPQAQGAAGAKLQEGVNHWSPVYSNPWEKILKKILNISLYTKHVISTYYFTTYSNKCIFKTSDLKLK